MRSSGFQRQRTSAWAVIERVETLHQSLEPFRTSQRRSFNNPLIETLGVGLRGISENDAVFHASSGSPSRIFRWASLSQPPRPPSHALFLREPPFRLCS